MEDGSRMNIYILLDTSGSIKKEDFDEARNATVALIRKVSTKCGNKYINHFVCNLHFFSFSLQLDSYNIQLRFHVLSFASQSIDIVNITDTDISTSSEDVIWYLMNFDHKSRPCISCSLLHLVSMSDYFSVIYVFVFIHLQATASGQAPTSTLHCTVSVR